MPANLITMAHVEGQKPGCARAAIGHATDAPPRSVMNSWERKLRPGEDHLRAAKELLLQKYNAGKKGSDFNRPLRYPPSGVA